MRARVQVPVYTLANAPLASTLLSILCSVDRPAAYSSLHAALHCTWQLQGATHSAVSVRAYSLVSSLQRHRGYSALLQLAAAVLAGRAPAQLLWRTADVCACTLRVFGAAARGVFHAGQARGVLAVEDARALLGRLLPNRADEDLERLCATCAMGQDHFACRKAAERPLDHLELACATAQCSSRDDAEREHMGQAGALDVPCSRSHGTQRTAVVGEETNSACNELGRGDMASCAPAGTPSQRCTKEGSLNGAATDNADTAAATERQNAQRSVQSAAKAELLLLVAEQHARKLLDLRAAVDAAFAELGTASDTALVPASAVRETLAKVPGMHMECTDACVRSIQKAAAACPSHYATEQPDSVPASVLADAGQLALPLQCAGDCDEAAAVTWLQGLQAHSQGHASAAGLPDVA